MCIRDSDEGAEGEGEEGAEKPEAVAQEEEPQGEITPRSLTVRVEALLESITYQALNYTRRGTLEDHKLIISTMLCFRIMIRKGLIP